MDSVTHLVPASVDAMWLSWLDSRSTDDGVGDRNKPDNSPLDHPPTLGMPLFLDGISLDMMMIVKSERLASSVAVRICSSHSH